MKPMILLTAQPLNPSQTGPYAPMPLPQLTPSGTHPKETIRHILLGSPSGLRQTIHLLHKLHYAETVLWSPILAIEEPLMITPERGEAISLLRRQF